MCCLIDACQKLQKYENILNVNSANAVVNLSCSAQTICGVINTEY